MAENDHLHIVLRAVRGLQSSVDLTRGGRGPTAMLASLSIAERATPTVFVSWAHSHASWNRSEAGEWESQLAEFAATLRSLGIDADIDLFHIDETMDWTRFGPLGIQSSDFTLVAVSESWSERWSGTNSPREGAGAAAEADTLRGLFARDQAEWQRRLVLVMFPEVHADVVPPDLQRATRVSVDPSDPDSYESLIRVLTGQPRYPKPPLGPVPSLGIAGDHPSDLLSELRARLAATESQKDRIARSHARPERREAERERLRLAESVIRGLIDVALKQGD